MNLPVESIGLVIAGVLICFAGWQIFRLSARFLGFILGAGTGYTLAVLASEMTGQTIPILWEPWIFLAIAILFGLLGVFLIKTIIKGILFLAGFQFGILLVAVYSGNVGDTIHAYGIAMILKHTSFWAIVSGVVFGILFVLFEKGFVLLYTSAVGAYLIVNYLSAPPAAFYCLLAAGAAIQLWMSRGSTVKNMKIAGEAS